MKKSYKIQKYFCVIPMLSTVVIGFITMLVLRKNRASFKLWSLMFLAMFGMLGLGSVAVPLLLQNCSDLVQQIASWIVLTVLNIILINLQIVSDRNPGAVPEKKPRWPWLLLLIPVIAATILSLSNPSAEYPDTNGTDNNSIATITNEMIIAENNRYSVYLSGGGGRGAKTFVDGALQKYDFAQYDCSFGKMNGVRTLQVTKVEHNEITLNFSSEIKSGNLEFFIIVDGVILHRVAANESKSITVTDIAGKNVIVKVAAESAEGNAHVSRSLRK